jgi:uncharacterized membrane protein
VFRVVYKAKTGSSSSKAVSSIIEIDVATAESTALFEVFMFVVEVVVVPFFFKLGERIRNNESRIEEVGVAGGDEDDLESRESLRFGSTATSSSLLSAIIPLCGLTPPTIPFPLVLLPITVVVVVFAVVVASFDRPFGFEIGSSFMIAIFSFLRRKKDDGDNDRLLLLDFVVGLVLLVLVVVVVVAVVVVVGDVFFVRKLILVDARASVFDVAPIAGGAVSGVSEVVASVNSGSLNDRKEDRNVCMCAYISNIWLKRRSRM